MPARDPRERALISRIAAGERWGRVTKEGRAEATSAARNALRAKFEREADPDGTLPLDERTRRADHLMRAHMQRMSLRAAQARRKAKEYIEQADAAEHELAELDAGPDDGEAA